MRDYGNNYTIGADPELGVFNNTLKKFVSAASFIRGTKEDPFKVSHGATQVDGVLAEFNINPAATLEEFNENINEVMNDLCEQIPEHHILVSDPVLNFDADYFASLSPVEQALGCCPDFNAYTTKQNDPPATTEPFRTCSGHIHVGGYKWGEDYKEDVHARVKQMDSVIYLSSLLWDDNTKRRILYGDPGAFRYKPEYGFEYRVLSNAWVGNVPLQSWVFLATVRTMELHDAGLEEKLDAVA
jgi:hypothetical protein